MAVDWMLEAATEVASYWKFGNGRDDYVTDEQRANIVKNIVTIFAEHSPFKPDTAYVEVKPHVWKRGRWTNVTTGEESDAPYDVCANCRLRSDSPRVPENCSNGVAYMPVPRCETCARLKPPLYTEPRSTHGWCILLNAAIPSAHFGCTHWTGKE